MDEILSNILAIDKNNEFLKHIVRRVRRDDYRGWHVSQHQRYDMNKALLVLRKFRKSLVGTEIMLVPRGDWSIKDKGRMRQLKEKYSSYNKLREGTGISPNSIKKHFFVDFTRAGFMEKYDKNNKLIPSEKKRAIYDGIKLTKEAIKMLEAKNIGSQYKIFTRGIENLVGDFLIDLVQTIDLSEYRRGRFSYEEHTFIFSDKGLGGDEKIALLKKYRKLPDQDKDKVLRLVKKYCKPKRFAGSKAKKRDYNNWRNETQQLFSLLKTTIYFEVFESGGKSFFRLNASDETGIFAPERSEEPKKMYFKQHQVAKKDDYELHHIVPLSFVKDKEHYKLFDDFRNLIYLHKDKHKKIKKDFVCFREKNPKIFFEDRFDSGKRIVAENNKNAAFNEKLLKEIKDYNKRLRETIS